MHALHLSAAAGTLSKHSGHSLVAAAGGSFGNKNLVSMNTTKAIMMKSTSAPNR